MFVEVAMPSIKKLIELVRKEPIVYNNNNANFRNKDLKTQAWEKISLQLGLPCKLIMFYFCF